MDAGGEKLFLEVPYDISSVPVSILAIPFVGAFATISMLIDECEIYVKSLDQTFADSIISIQNVYRKMYSKTNLTLNVYCEEKVQNQYDENMKYSLFFTSGVDASSALVEVVHMKPLLVNIWGGDLWITDDASHENLKTYLDNLTNFLGLKYCFVKTNARAIFEEEKLGWMCEKKLGHKYNHGWWASIAHILLMTTAIAPVMYVKNIGVHYIGSSYEAGSDTYDGNNADLIHAIKFASGTFEIVDNNQVVEQLARMNEQLAIRNRRSERIWKGIGRLEKSSNGTIEKMLP